jgi:hypothetical protein
MTDYTMVRAPTLAPVWGLRWLRGADSPAGSLCRLAAVRRLLNRDEAGDGRAHDVQAVIEVKGLFGQPPHG